MSAISLTYQGQFRTNTPAAPSDRTDEPSPDILEAAAVLELVVETLQDGLDHPEVWSAWPNFLAGFPALATLVEQHWLLAQPGDPLTLVATIAHALCTGYGQDPASGIAIMQPLIQQHPHSAAALGVLAFLEGMPRGSAQPHTAADPAHQQ